jgi:hypothetical protein
MFKQRELIRLLQISFWLGFLLCPIIGEFMFNPNYAFSIIGLTLPLAILNIQRGKTRI